jgi:hypothetical protein
LAELFLDNVTHRFKIDTAVDQTPIDEHGRRTREPKRLAFGQTCSDRFGPLA